MNSNLTIEVKHLQVGYNGKSTSDFNYPEINVTALNNELIALVGRNGVGKSTLLRTIARLQKSIAGNILINGKEVEKTDRNKLATLLSFIPAEPVHSPNTTVYDFVSLARYPYHSWFDALNTSDKFVIERALKAVEMVSYKNRQIDRLSDGERQRAMIAFAIAQDTPIILMDEPTAFLDLPNKFEVVRLLKEQSENGKTVILSTHDIQTAFGFVDTIWLMLPDGLRVGAPEDMVLTDAINRLMKDTLVKFDLNTGQFDYNIPKQKSVIISGEDKSIINWTAHALARLGYQTVKKVKNENTLSVEILNNEGKVQWCLNEVQRKPTFDSIRNLCIYLKMDYKNLE